MLPAVIPGGSLFRCKACSLGYRYPCLPKSSLDELYRQGSTTAWDSSPSIRTDWNLARNLIEKRFVGKQHDVLDIGCFDGAFLASLAQAKRFGVEINTAAADVARQRGIEILGEDCTSDNASIADFDAITAFDLLEHVDDPRNFLASYSRRLRHGGLLLVSTGNLDAWTWRMAGGRYWYCAIPEHISFLSRRWFERTASELGLGVVEMLPFAHENSSPKAKFTEAARNAVYLLAPKIARYLRTKGFGKLDVSTQPDMLDFPPKWMSARDHLLAVFAKQ
jgi:SAM-dependent methyltransferase